MVQYLIENNAKLTESTALGDNSLKIAQKYGHQEIALMLVSKGIQRNFFNSNFLGVSLRSSKGFKIVSKPSLLDKEPKPL